jgi:hypothetical protein
VFVPGKLFQPSLTDTRFVQKSLNHGQKMFYNSGPQALVAMIMLGQIDFLGTNANANLASSPLML